jgi:mono/diheme cytochrome c family protein
MGHVTVFVITCSARGGNFMTQFKMLSLVAVPAAATLALISAMAACGDSSSKKADPAPTVAPTSPAQATIPTKFTSACSGCHGDDGTKAVGADGDKLKGTDLTEAEFKAIVKDGKGGGAMPAGLATPEEAAAIWAFFKK